MMSSINNYSSPAEEAFSNSSRAATWSVFNGLVASWVNVFICFSGFSNHCGLTNVTMTFVFYVVSNVKVIDDEQ